MQTRFKIGDYITHMEGCSGFEDAIVTGIDENYYHLRIPNGIATVKISAEINYEIKKDKKVLNIR